MSEATAPVRLHYRRVPLAEPPAVKTVADGVFVALSAPPPVRTVLRLEHADGTVQAIEVTRVVEVEGEGDRGQRGFYARIVAGDVLAASDRVGSEHLSAPQSPDRGGPGNEDQSTGEDDPSDAGHFAMAMPAPVVVDDDDDDDDATAQESDGGSDEESASSDSEGEDASSSRKGRARKRRAKKPRK